MRSDSGRVEMKGNDITGRITRNVKVRARRRSDTASRGKAKFIDRARSLSSLRAKKDEKDEADEDDPANPNFGNFRHKNYPKEGCTSPAR
jgi:hypothetical protein